MRSCGIAMLSIMAENSARGTTEKAKQAADAYAVIIQIGAILVVVGLYRRRTQMVLGLLGRDVKGLRLVVMHCQAFMPAALLGLALGDEIKTRLFGPWPIVAGWLGGGIAILVKPWKGIGQEDTGF
jgi:undecaprenyl-diphosphatase